MNSAQLGQEISVKVVLITFIIFAQVFCSISLAISADRKEKSTCIFDLVTLLRSVPTNCDIHVVHTLTSGAEVLNMGPKYVWPTIIFALRKLLFKQKTDHEQFLAAVEVSRGRAGNCRLSLAIVSSKILDKNGNVPSSLRSGFFWLSDPYIWPLQIYSHLL